MPVSGRLRGTYPIVVALALLGLCPDLVLSTALLPLAPSLAHDLGTSQTWLQVTSRFCVAFGALGLENFGRLGRQVRVDGPQRAADRKRALQLIAEGAVIGLALTLAIVPLRL